MSSYSQIKKAIQHNIDKSKKYIYKHPMKAKIIIVVFTAHLILASSVVISAPKQNGAIKIKPLAVKTITPTPITTSTKPAKPKTTEKKRPTSKKQSKPTKKPSETISQDKKNLLKKLRKNLSSIEPETIKPEKIALSIPDHISQLSVDKQFNDDKKSHDLENTYTNLLIAKLQNAMQLPEYGQVKIRMTISRTGDIEKIEVLESESDKNSAYIKNVLQHIVFPHFGTNFHGEERHIFNIVLSNEI